MKTLSREPWRGGQICGYQTAYGLPSSVFCGKFKKLNSPLCPEHDEQMHEEHGGSLPEFADGNALGLAAYRRTTMPYLFQLAWEPMNGGGPVPATEEEITAWQAS